MTSSETIKPMMVKMKLTQGIYPRSSNFEFETLKFGGRPAFAKAAA